MSLQGIISVSGMRGLYKVLTQTKSGFIVESLDDKKRQPISGTQQISMLEDISIFTISDDMPLKDVFVKMKSLEEDVPVISAKSSGEDLKNYFRKVLPDFDEERVYTSDIKKIISWFNAVRELLDSEDPNDDENNSGDNDVVGEGAEAQKEDESAPGKQAE